MRFADFPFLRYLPFFIAGILISENFPFSSFWLALVLGICWIGYVFLLQSRGKKFLFQGSILAYVGLFFCGLFLGKFQRELPSNSPEPRLSGGNFFAAEVMKYDVAKPNSSENLLEIFAFRDSTGWLQTREKVLIYHQSSLGLEPGQVVYFQKKPQLIPAPIFPNEFNYKEYLSRKEIYSRVFLGKEIHVFDSLGRESPHFELSRIREKLSQILRQYLHNARSLVIATALLLGDKEGLDPAIQEAYSQTGTMHILAVSGLHVGIIYLILVFPIKGRIISKKARKIHLLIVVGLIWGYALLTGFSPSVIRAATMFSLVTFGQMRERKPSIWNVLAFSAMLILSFDPQVIYELGFQLSYLAVAGIVGLQPILLRLWETKNAILEYVWQMATVSMAAQLATFPLTVYYFHLFPTYFLFANLLIVPMAFVSMVGGLALLAFHWIPGVGWMLGWLLDHLIEAQNWIAEFFQQLPGGVLDRLTLTFSAMALIWLGLMVLGNWEWGDRKKLVFLLLLVIFVWRMEVLVSEVQRPSRMVFLYSSAKGTLFDLRLGRHSLAWNQDFEPDQISYSIDPDRIRSGRPQMPQVLQGIAADSSIYFPGLGFSFSPEKRMVYFEEGNGIHLADNSVSN